MNQRVYKYGIVYQIVRYILLATVIWLPIVILLNSFINHSWDVFFLHNPQYWLLLAIVSLVFGYNGIVYGHVFSTIKTDEDGLYVEYFWRYIFFPWSEVTLKRSVLYIKSLPLFYYGQGLLFRWSLKKIMLIFPNIANYQMLLDEIGKNTKNNKQRYEKND